MKQVWNFFLCRKKYIQFSSYGTDKYFLTGRVHQNMMLDIVDNSSHPQTLPKSKYVWQTETRFIIVVATILYL